MRMQWVVNCIQTYAYMQLRWWLSAPDAGCLPALICQANPTLEVALVRRVLAKAAEYVVLGLTEIDIY